MKLIFLLSLIFAPLHILSYDYHVLGELPKYSSKIFYPQSAKYLDNAYYVRLSDFPKDDTLYFKVTIRYGYFTRGYMYYQGYNYIPSDTVSLSSSKDYHSRDYSSVMSGLFYNSYTYYYKISKPSTTYLFVGHPDYRYQNSLSSIEVYSTNSFGISIWVWIGIGIFVFVVIILSIVFYACRRAQRKAQEQNLQNPTIDPIPLNVGQGTNEPLNVNPNPIPPPSPAPYVPNPNVYTPIQYPPVQSPYIQPPPVY